jgi:hypothetical protein
VTDEPAKSLHERLDDHERARAALKADLQPERTGPRVSELPVLWRCQLGGYPPSASGERIVLRLCAEELEEALAREPHLTLSADAVKTLAGSRDLERRCAQLQRQVEVYRRALAQIISVHALGQL